MCSFFLHVIQNFIRDKSLNKVPSKTCSPVSASTFIFPIYITISSTSDQLSEGTVDRRANRLDVFPEVDGSNSALGDTFGRELEFLIVC
jgi:hypothetical protein